MVLISRKKGYEQLNFSVCHSIVEVRRPSIVRNKNIFAPKYSPNLYVSEKKRLLFTCAHRNTGKNHRRKTSCNVSTLRLIYLNYFPMKILCFRSLCQNKRPTALAQPNLRSFRFRFLSHSLPLLLFSVVRVCQSSRIARIKTNLIFFSRSAFVVCLVPTMAIFCADEAISSAYKMSSFSDLKSIRFRSIKCYFASSST